jgi:hypothetical protein
MVRGRPAHKSGKYVERDSVAALITHQGESLSL